MSCRGEPGVEGYLAVHKVAEAIDLSAGHGTAARAEAAIRETVRRMRAWGETVDAGGERGGDPLPFDLALDAFCDFLGLSQDR